VKIPSCFYGVKKEAKRECAKVARKILKGVPLLEAVAAYQMIDTKDVPEAPLIICNPYGILDKTPFFYMTLVADAAENTIRGKFWREYGGGRDIYEMAAKQFMEHSWGILGLSESEGWIIASPNRERDRRHLWQPYLQKLCEFWDIFNGEGRRYFGQGSQLSSFWGANRTLQYVLSGMGVSWEEGVYEPPEPTNLRWLCDKYNLLTMDVINSPTVLAKHPYAN